MKEVKNSDRMIYLDLLRIVAAFSVVMLHSAAQFWYVLDIRSREWVIANSYDAVFRFGVPIFVMISGALFLKPAYKLDVKRLYTHNILRLVILYIVWSCLYGLLDCVMFFDIRALSLKEIAREMLTGRYHLWFLCMLAGIYVLLPIVKSWLEHAKKSEIQYLIVLFLILQIGVETLRALTVSDELHGILNLTRVDLICSYMGYFIWGYYLAHVGISAKRQKIFCWGLLPSMVINVVLGNMLAWRAGEPVAAIYDSFGLFTFVMATALFLICSQTKREYSKRTVTILREISSGTLGVYLMHIAVMEVTEYYGLNSMILPNIVGIPLYAIGCFVFCLLVSMGLRRLPVVGRYLC